MVHDYKSKLLEEMKTDRKVFYILSGAICFCCFSVVYIIPAILRWQGLEEYFLFVSQKYEVAFIYKKDVLVNAVAKMYFIFVFPFVGGVILSVFLIFNYRKSVYKRPKAYIHKYKEDFLMFMGCVFFCFSSVFVLYFTGSSEPVLWKYQGYFSNSLFFLAFVFIVHVGMLVWFGGLAILLIDFVSSFFEGEV